MWNLKLRGCVYELLMTIEYTRPLIEITITWYLNITCGISVCLLEVPMTNPLGITVALLCILLSIVSMTIYIEWVQNWATSLTTSEASIKFLHVMNN